MNAPDLLRWAEAEGVHVHRVGERLRLVADHEPPAELVAALRTHKAELLALVPANDSTGVLVLVYEVDGKQATCIDPVSASLEVALTDLQIMYGHRLERIWHEGVLVHEPLRTLH